MKLELTDEDRKKFERDEKSNPIIRYLKNQENLRFQVGDILIRQTTRSSIHGSPKWETTTVSNVSKAPKKFMYVFENDFGVGYIKQLKASGDGFTEYYACLANVDTDYVRYIIDPDYADHMLIEGNADNYKPSTLFEEDRALRLETVEHNKKLLEDTRSYKSVNAVIDSLKPGDKIWYGEDIYRAVDREYTIVSIMTKKIDSFAWGSVKGDGTDDFYREVQLVAKDGFKFSRNTEHIRHKKLFIKPPRKFKDS